MAVDEAMRDALVEANVGFAADQAAHAREHSLVSSCKNFE
jgi:predicted class III extradiol MEMO1 family dioxygenase